MTKRMKMAVVAVAALVLALGGTAQAGVTAYTGFDYGTSDLGGASSTNDVGFTGAWDSSTTQPLNTGASLSYPTGANLSSQTGMISDTNGGANYRGLSTTLGLTSNDTWYVSFLASTTYAFGVQLRDGTATSWDFGVGGSTFQNQVAAYSGGYTRDWDGVPVVSGATYLIVCKLEANGAGAAVGSQVSYRVGVDTVGNEPVTWGVVVTEQAASSAVLDRIYVSSNGSASSFQFDELRIGTTWADVTGVPEPATIALLTIGALGVLRRRRRA